MSKPKLSVVVHLPGGVTRLDFDQINPRLLIGSDPTCQVRVPSALPVHAEVSYQGDSLVVVDRSHGDFLVGGSLGLYASQEVRLPYQKPLSIFLRGGGVRIDLTSNAFDAAQRFPRVLVKRANTSSPAKGIVEEIPSQPGPRGRADLILITGDLTKIFTLASGETAIIGRSQRCDLRIPESAEGVSSQHARLSWVNGWLVVDDLASTNGTWVEGRKIERVVIGPDEDRTLELAHASASLSIRVVAAAVVPVRGPVKQKRATNTATSRSEQDEDEEEHDEVQARGRTVQQELAASAVKGLRDTFPWVDLPASPAGQVAPRAKSVLAVALALMAENTEGVTLSEIKAAFEAIQMGHHDPKRLLQWASRNRGWGFAMNRETGRIRPVTSTPVQSHPVEPRASIPRDDEAAVYDNDVGVEQERHRVDFHGRTVDELERRRVQLESTLERERQADRERRRSEFLERQRFEEEKRRFHAAGGETVSYLVEARAGRPVAGMHRLHAKVIPASQTSLSYGGSAELELALEGAEGTDVQVELCDAPDARISGGCVIATVGQAFEVLFRLAGDVEERVPVRLRHATRSAAIASKTTDERFQVVLRTRIVVPVAVPAVPSVASSAPEWLSALPDGVRDVFRHLADHGSINEQEATRLLGGARQFRNFSLHLDDYRSRAPFAVRVDVSSGTKCYVRGDV